jgi:hypothetical protein
MESNILMILFIVYCLSVPLAFIYASWYELFVENNSTIFIVLFSLFWPCIAIAEVLSISAQWVFAKFVRSVEHLDQKIKNYKHQHQLKSKNQQVVLAESFSYREPAGKACHECGSKIDHTPLRGTE